jgi:raffinose/stachyose/melibiose transport system permease protein
MRKYTAVRASKHFIGYLFNLPLLVFISVFFVYSFYFLFKTSLQDVDITFNNPIYVGFDNYLLVLKDLNFYSAIKNNLIFALVTVLLSLTLGYVISIFFQFQFFGKRLVHAFIFLPTLMPLALIATVMGMMLESKYGTLNIVLNTIGLNELALPWLNDPLLAYSSVLFVSVFLIGLPVMYYTAELSTIDRGILEAAVIDGARMSQIMRFILFPMLKNSHKTIILTMLLGSFREFERVYLMTMGGPGRSTEIISTYLFSYTRTGISLGFVASASVIVLAIVFLFAIIQFRIFRQS